ncbi:MAG: hypothetical protein P4L81_03475 [Candidatus Pacebacteria bacterium]|nr:hypothetical protein [Candidatus Paceibacterota bacterium]
MTAPIVFTWTGSEMKPLRRFEKACDNAFVIGENYSLAEHLDRSANTHRHFFAALHDAWLNLPEAVAERFPTEESLRKFALIKCGFADSRQFVAASKAEATRLAAFIRPSDEYALVTVSGHVVTVWTAQSQSMRAMGKERFQESKTRVLDYVASLISVAPAQLAREAGQAA